MNDTKILTERDLFRSFWDEGSLDLLAGMALLLTGAGWPSEIGALAVIQAPLWIVLWRPLRRLVVEPRAGFVRFSLARRKKTTRGLAETLALGVGLFAVVLLAVLVVRERSALPSLALAVDGLPAVLVALLATLAGFLTGARRFHAYALGLVVGAAVTVVFALGPAVPLVVVALVVIATGAILLGRFLRDARAFRESS